MAWKPNAIWIYDFTHFTACGRAAIAVLDVVSRYWLTTLVSAQETSLQVEVAFIDALTTAGLAHLIDLDTLRLLRSGQIRLSDLDGRPPVLLAMSDNGPQMRSHDTRQMMAAFAIGQQFGRPSTPTELSRPGARFRDRSRPVSPGRSPNPPCAFRRNGLSTVTVIRRGS